MQTPTKDTMKQQAQSQDEQQAPTQDEDEQQAPPHDEQQVRRVHAIVQLAVLLWSMQSFGWLCCYVQICLFDCALRMQDDGSDMDWADRDSYDNEDDGGAGGGVCLPQDGGGKDNDQHVGDNDGDAGSSPRRLRAVDEDVGSVHVTKKPRTDQDEPTLQIAQQVSDALFVYSGLVTVAQRPLKRMCAMHVCTDLHQLGPGRTRHTALTGAASTVVKSVSHRAPGPRERTSRQY